MRVLRFVGLVVRDVARITLFLIPHLIEFVVKMLAIIIGSLLFAMTVNIPGGSKPPNFFSDDK